jgi:1-acyl-sn-glycerol-3-phosphate acyltransferase
MVAGALGLIGLYALGLSPPQILLVLAAANAIVAAAVYFAIPEFLFRFVLWMLARVFYRVRIHGAENFPETGPALLVCNHVSFIDWLMISAACRRPIRFVMHVDFMKIPVFGTFFRHAKVIPIAGVQEDLGVMKAAFQTISRELRAGHLVCIFPEGEITRNGELARFRRGIEQALSVDPVPVIPMALSGMWGSFFSRYHGRAMSKPFRRFWSRVDLRIASPVPPEEATAERLQTIVARMLGVKTPGASRESQ